MLSEIDSRLIRALYFIKDSVNDLPVKFGDEIGATNISAREFKHEVVSIINKLIENVNQGGSRETIG